MTAMAFEPLSKPNALNETQAYFRRGTCQQQALQDDLDRSFLASESMRQDCRSQPATSSMPLISRHYENCGCAEHAIKSLPNLEWTQEIMLVKPLLSNHIQIRIRVMKQHRQGRVHHCQPHVLRWRQPWGPNSSYRTPFNTAQCVLNMLVQRCICPKSTTLEPRLGSCMPCSISCEQLCMAAVA